MRKPDFCICENKDADQLHSNSTADQRLCFRYIYSAKKSSAQMGFQVNPVFARKSCIKCYISLFTEIILQHLDAFKIEI